MPRGRPRLSSHPMKRIDVRLPQPLYDALRRASDRAHASMQTTARKALIKFLTVEKEKASVVTAS